MKRILYLLGILLVILLGAYFGWKLCCNDEVVEEAKVEIPEPPKEDPKPSISFGVLDADGNITIPVNGGVKFKKSSITFNSPVSEELDKKIDQLKEYLVSEKEKSLSITSYYTSDETNNSVFPNVGLARAISFKNYVSKKGIPTKLIDVKGELRDDLEVDEDENIKKPLKLSVGKSKDYSKLLASIIKDIEENPLVLNFETGKTKIKLNPNQRRKIVNISTYLDKVDASFCLITGHTDNTGSAKRNMYLGQERANFLKEYFTKSGILEDRLKAVSKGETEPIATNKTKAGRAKNRRSDVALNK
ncbi:OmpA family protein [Tenacibaculum xiamenense]|uniref:OmpA family protein n=1 Tax=Tenacibaculum xiamenense TaxID=1261553 RepID=UPI003895DDBC